MLKKYKNKLFETVRDSKLQIENFQITEGVNDFGNGTFLLEYLRTPFHFLLRNQKDSFELFDCRYIRFNPSFSETDFVPEQGFYSFDRIHLEFLTWLKDHLLSYLNEAEEIDMWWQYKNGNKTLNIDSIDFDNKDLFSIDEKAQITLALNDLKLLIENRFQLNEKEMHVVNARLNYLIEAKERLNKFDWKSLLINTIINITAALSLDTHKGQELFLLFKHAFEMIPQLGSYMATG